MVSAVQVTDLLKASAIRWMSSEVILKLFTFVLQKLFLNLEISNLREIVAEFYQFI